MNDLLSNLDLDEPGEVEPPKSHPIEQAILLLADMVWAVVGLVLWIPQIVRVVVTSAARLVHAALTRQPIDSIRGPIRQVSRFYVDGFLSPGRQASVSNYGRRELQLGRFLIEAAWVSAVWLGVLHLVDREAFLRVRQTLSRFVVWAWGWLVELTTTLAGYLPDSIRDFVDLGTGASLVLGFALTVFFVVGFFLGRRSR